MAGDKIDIVSLRKSRGFSKEKPAAICGIIERTIQRIEKNGTCSVESRLALASAFDLSPNELVNRTETPAESGEYIDLSGALVLFILGMAFPTTILLTGTNGIWEIMSFFAVVGLTITISIMTHGAKATHKLLDNTNQY